MGEIICLNKFYSNNSYKLLQHLIHYYLVWRYFSPSLLYFAFVVHCRQVINLILALFGLMTRRALVHNLLTLYTSLSHSPVTRHQLLRPAVGVWLSLLSTYLVLVKFCWKRASFLGAYVLISFVFIEFLPSPLLLFLLYFIALVVDCIIVIVTVMLLRVNLRRLN